MKSTLVRLLLFFFLGACPLVASAEQVPAVDLLDAKTDYSADYYLRMDGRGEYDGTVIHAPGRDRREFATAHGRQILLLRRDIGEATMMWPERKWYLRVPLSTAESLVGGLDGMTLERRQTGADVISGERCTRYDVTATSGESAFSGRMWFTSDGILMQAEGTVTYQGRPTKMKTGLSHLLRVQADPAAFVPPSDYKGLPFDPQKYGFGGHHQ